MDEEQTLTSVAPFRFLSEGMIQPRSQGLSSSRPDSCKVYFFIEDSSRLLL